MNNRDMYETKVILRCELCGKFEEESKAKGWRVELAQDTTPIWACAECLTANASEAVHRLQTLADARNNKTPPLSEIEWLSIFCDGQED